MKTQTRAVAAGLVVVAVAPFLVFAAPQLVGASHSYVVLTSSMSPTINAGDVVLVSDVEPSRIEDGDIITFDPESGPLASREKVITHRVVDVETESGERRFLTRGDANDSPDGPPVPGRHVVGKVVFTVPLIGYVVGFASSNLGVLLFVVVPALLLIVTELRDLRTAMGSTDAETSRPGVGDETNSLRDD